MPGIISGYYCDGSDTYRKEAVSLQKKGRKLHGAIFLFVGQDLHSDPSRPRPVEFAEKDALPGSEEQPAVFNQQCLGRADQGRFSEFPSEWVKYGALGTILSRNLPISDRTAGSAPSLTVMPAVVWSAKRWQTPLRTPAIRSNSRTSPVMSMNSVLALLVISM